MAEAGRACTEFWCAIATTRGVKIEVAHSSGLLDTNVPENEKLYGYHRLEDPLVQSHKSGGLLITGSLRWSHQSHWIKTPIIFGRHDHKSHEWGRSKKCLV